MADQLPQDIVKAATPDPGVAKPIVVNPNLLPAQALSAARVLAVALGAIVSVIGFLGGRDLAGLIVYLRSSEGVTAMGAVIAVAAFLWGQLSTWRRNAEKVVLAKAAPDAVAVLKQGAALIDQDAPGPPPRGGSGAQREPGE